MAEEVQALAPACSRKYRMHGGSSGSRGVENRRSAAVAWRVVCKRCGVHAAVKVGSCGAHHCTGAGID